MAIRGLQEEIGNIPKEKISVDLLGFVFDKKYNQWNIIGQIYINLTQDELIKRRNSGSGGKWELKSIDFVPFTPKETVAYLATHRIWDMGLVTTYFSLVWAGYSKDSIDQQINKHPAFNR